MCGNAWKALTVGGVGFAFLANGSSSDSSSFSSAPSSSSSLLAAFLAFDFGGAGRFDRPLSLLADFDGGVEFFSEPLLFLLFLTAFLFFACHNRSLFFSIYVQR